MRIFLLGLVSIFLSLSGIKSNSVLSSKESKMMTKPLNEVDSWEHFKNIINYNNVKSIDELLAVLPEDFKKGYSLLYKTSALSPELVSPKRPRVLMFGWKGKFMMTYNSHPSGGKAPIGSKEILETIYFSQKGVELREIEFNGIKDPLANMIEVNPARCTNCHGIDPKGLWDPYNMWPGAFGSLSRGGMDFIRTGSLEHRYLMEYLEEKPTNPRYNFLEDNFKTLSQWSSEVTLIRPFNPATMHDAIVVSDGHSSIPNQRLGMIMGEENLKRLGRSILNLPKDKLNAFKYIIYGLASDENYTRPKDKTYSCSKKIESFLPSEVSINIRSFSAFQTYFENAALQDYKRLRDLTLIFNQGLSKVGGGFDNFDPFDLDDQKRVLIYDPLPIPSRFSEKTGVSGAMMLAYFLRIVGLDDYEMNIAVNSARYNMYYGSTAECSLPSDGVNPFISRCTDESVERFFSTYVLPHLKDKDLEKLSCKDLSKMSKTSSFRSILDCLDRSGLKFPVLGS